MIVDLDSLPQSEVQAILDCKARLENLIEQLRDDLIADQAKPALVFSVIAAISGYAAQIENEPLRCWLGTVIYLLVKEAPVYRGTTLPIVEAALWHIEYVLKGGSNVVKAA